jgi:hypothetical protein
VNCLAVPTYGPLLPTQRLCNHTLQLPAIGTFITSAYPSAGLANRRPPGVSVASFTLQRPTLLGPGEAVVKLALAPGATYPASRHVVSIVLVNAATGAPVGLDYRADTTTALDAGGNIASVRLVVPTGAALPAHVRAYVVADVFPLAQAVF